jgi:hypothetical protein
MGPSSSGLKLHRFYQPLPTVGMITPEPGTLGAGLLVILLMLAAKCRTKVLNTVLKQ